MSGRGDKREWDAAGTTHWMESAFIMSVGTCIGTVSRDKGAFLLGVGPHRRVAACLCCQLSQPSEVNISHGLVISCYLHLPHDGLHHRIMRKGLANTRRTHITFRPISSARTLEGKSVETRMMGGADVHSPNLRPVEHS